MKDILHFMFSLSLTEGTKHLEAILGKSACK